MQKEGIEHKFVEPDRAMKEGAALLPVRNLPPRAWMFSIRTPALPSKEVQHLPGFLDCQLVRPPHGGGEDLRLQGWCVLLSL